MAGLARRIERIWYGTEAPPWWLRALVPVYRGLRWLHLAPYRFGWRHARRLPVPVIVVGNLTDLRGAPRELPRKTSIV